MKLIKQTLRKRKKERGSYRIACECEQVNKLIIYPVCVYLCVYHVQEPSFQQRVQLDLIDREATAWRDTAIARIPQCIGAIPMPRFRRYWRREFRPICQ